VSRLGARRGERGFTIVETLAALTVFSLITIGIVPLLGNSMRALGMSQGRAVAENVARAAVERLQGIKFYVSWDAKAKKVDLLDLYLPQTAGTFEGGQSYSTSAANPPLTSPASGGTGVFTTVCPAPAGSTTEACPPNIPAGHTLTFKASFVEPVTTTTPQTYRVVNPLPSYSATPGVAGTCQTAPCSDKPPADLIDVKVTETWTHAGSSENFVLDALVGDRSFSSGPVSDAAPPGPSAAPTAPPAAGGLRVQGNATIDYGLRADTSFALTQAQFPAACLSEPCNHSDMIYTLGISDARIETKDSSTADVSTKFGEARVIRTYPAGTTPPASPPPDLFYANGATSIMHAPPTDTRLLDDQRTGIIDVSNPDQPMALQGRIYQNENHDMKVDVSNELPQAEGNFRAPSGATGTIEWYINHTQRDTSNVGPMHLDPAQPIILGQKYATTTGANWFRGFTKANTFGLGTAGRAVHTTASIDIPWFFIFPRIYAGTNGRDSFAPLQFFDFAADVGCKSTANPATAQATATWSTGFMYRYDTANNGGSRDITLGQATINSSGNDILNGVAVPDALAAIKAQNPLIFDGSSNAADVYLFEVRSGTTVTKRGYLSDWAVDKNVETSTSADGRTTSASINGAIRIETAGLRQTMSPELPQTAISLALAKMSCNAVDNR
jgi:type II secretory pathway pseudopilin PulG